MAEGNSAQESSHGSTPESAAQVSATEKPIVQAIIEQGTGLLYGKPTAKKLLGLEQRLANLADAVQDPTTTFQLREVIQQWHKHMDNIYLQRLGSIANANQAYKDGIQLLLKQRYPSGYIRVYRGGRSARGAHLNPLERAYTNVTTSRETAKNFQPANDAWNTLDIDNIIIRIEDVVSITSVKESELIIPGAVLKERIANPLTVAQTTQDDIYRQGKK